MQKEILSFSKMHVEGDQVITATHDELLMKDGRVLKDTMSGLWNVTLGYSSNSQLDNGDSRLITVAVY